jgi:rRNA maturation endonuclease Nob1
MMELDENFGIKRFGLRNGKIFKTIFSLKSMKKKKCLECKKEFEVRPRARFERKYCETCGKKRKKMWDNQWKLKIEDFDDEDE